MRGRERGEKIMKVGEEEGEGNKRMEMDCKRGRG